ncbi:hypothetical protein [Pseudomonas fulva]|uniref:hypothetical protein n=1 Tax=Pseudomonas fulva TaxID=47880 RepID=UPI003D2EF23A
MKLKAIETNYKGYKFRSRLEARWAVFFDDIGAPWEYEKQGYDLGGGLKFLPDFWLPHHELFFEVKGAPPTDVERLKAHLLSVCSKKAVVLASGTMELDCAQNLSNIKNIFNLEIFAGEAWDNWEVKAGGADLYDWNISEFMPKFIMKNFEGVYLSGDDSPEKRRAMIELDKIYYRQKHHKEHPSYIWGRHASVAMEGCPLLTFKISQICCPSRDIKKSYDIAKSKRFEF